jgi:hypothetical protein
VGDLRLWMMAEQNLHGASPDMRLDCGNAAAYVGCADTLCLKKFSKRRQRIQILPHLTGAKLDFPNLLSLELEHSVNQRLHPSCTQAERAHTTSDPILVERGLFTGWVAQHAKVLNGMSIVVGRGRSGVVSADRVYAMMTLPPEPRTFKLVIGWEQPDRFRDRFRPRR